MVTDSIRDGCGECGSVLVFDEERVIIDLLAVVLKREGYVVTTAARHEEALESFSRGTFDLAITDLGLHNGHGGHLVRKIKEISPRTAIVSMAAYPTAEIQRFAEEHTAAFLAKPFDISELLAAVRGALEGKSVKESAPVRGGALGRRAPVAAVS